MRKLIIAVCAITAGCQNVEERRMAIDDQGCVWTIEIIADASRAVPVGCQRLAEEPADAS
jgi:hypothetical protein